MNAKSIAWVLITGTAVVTVTGIFVLEVGLAVASLVLGGMALVTSVFARGSISEHSMRVRTKVEGLQKSA